MRIPSTAGTQDVERSSLFGGSLANTLDKRISESFRRAAAAEIRRGAILRRYRRANRQTQALCLFDQTQVIEHLARRQQQRARIRDALAGNVGRRAMHGFED